MTGSKYDYATGWIPVLHDAHVEHRKNLVRELEDEADSIALDKGYAYLAHCYGVVYWGSSFGVGYRQMYVDLKLGGRL